MDTTKVFTSGNSQAVRIPQHLRLRTETVYIQRIGSAVVLLLTDDLWDALFASRELVSDDFMETRVQQPWQERAWPR